MHLYTGWVFNIPGSKHMRVGAELSAPFSFLSKVSPDFKKRRLKFVTKGAFLHPKEK